jgi:hypothetical protein
MTYRKVGGLHFIKIGRFGFTFYVSKPVARVRQEDATARPFSLLSNHHNL